MLEVSLNVHLCTITFYGESIHMKAKTLRLGHPLKVLRPTMHNGPGWRIGLWTQGCLLRCTKKCLNPHLLSSEGGFIYPIEEILSSISKLLVSSSREVEGVTVLGGEPTDQAEPLAFLLREIRNLGLSTMVYSGYRLSALLSSDNPHVMALLNESDLLVDGPFLADEYDDSLSWRGSQNQVIHILTKRYNEESLQEAFQRQKKGFSIMVRPEGYMSFSGFQNREPASDTERLLHTIEKELKERKRERTGEEQATKV